MTFRKRSLFAHLSPAFFAIALAGCPFAMNDDYVIASQGVTPPLVDAGTTDERPPTVVPTPEASPPPVNQPDAAPPCQCDANCQNCDNPHCPMDKMQRDCKPGACKGQGC